MGFFFNVVILNFFFQKLVEFTLAKKIQIEYFPILENKRKRENKEKII